MLRPRAIQEGSQNFRLAPYLLGHRRASIDMAWADNLLM
jgi:hypothetical protein